jgi:hypothetical protein
MPSVIMCSGGASKSKNAEALRLSTVTSVGASASTATGTWDDGPGSELQMGAPIFAARRQRQTRIRRYLGYIFSSLLRCRSCFVQVTDPIGQRLVPNLTRPGGHITGFINFELHRNQVDGGAQAGGRVRHGRATSRGSTLAPPAICGCDGSKPWPSSRFKTNERATRKASFKVAARRRATLKKASPK